MSCSIGPKHSSLLSVVGDEETQEGGVKLHLSRFPESWKARVYPVALINLHGSIDLSRLRAGKWFW
jgi:hypothetical protein